ncbi:hypothetical protein CRENBAI_007798 [Crenichthys baileyi]|uniref:Uncharacterized protein n=1 Tax=Crenichthys baileyi TaxID=28760 RepID=A0AAV9RMP3_9TELE
MKFRRAAWRPSRAGTEFRRAARRPAEQSRGHLEQPTRRTAMKKPANGAETAGVLGEAVQIRERPAEPQLTEAVHPRIPYGEQKVKATRPGAPQEQKPEPERRQFVPRTPPEQAEEAVRPRTPPGQDQKWDQEVKDVEAARSRTPPGQEPDAEVASS